MTEREWMNAHLQRKTWGWEELVGSGRASLSNLDDGPLKQRLEAWLIASREHDAGKDAAAAGRDALRGMTMAKQTNILHTQTLHKECEAAIRRKAAWEGSRRYAAENWPTLVCADCRENFTKPANPNHVNPMAGVPKPKSVLQLAREMGLRFHG